MDLIRNGRRKSTPPRAIPPRRIPARLRIPAPPRIPAPALRLLAACLTALLLCLAPGFAPGAGAAGAVLEKFLPEVPAATLVEGASGYGAPLPDLPVAPVLKDGETIGYAFITSDFVGTAGYSGKPIHVMVALGKDGRILGAELVKHHEPIVLIGIPNSKIKALTASYRGLDIVREAKAGGSAHDVEIISGATVTIMIIDDSIVRASLKVARALGLGGLEKESAARGPRFVVNTEDREIRDWFDMLGDGTIRRLSLDIGQVNEAFRALGDPRVLKHEEKGDPGETFIDLYLAPVSVPGIGLGLLGQNEYANLENWLGEGDQAILLAGRGRFSFKGSGYVRGGIFDRIQLIQGDVSVRFRDRNHRRLREIAADGAPRLDEVDLFRIPADSGFDITRPFRLQLLVNRAVGPVEKTFLTWDLEYRLPERYLIEVVEPRALPSAGTPAQAAAAATGPGGDEGSARAALWKKVWQAKTVEVGLLVGMLTILTGVFFFQVQVTRHKRAFWWFRMAFLTATLFFLGWAENAQLSIVNLMALMASLREGFSWDTFLMDPLVFILWCSVAVTIIFWGRGGYCGWLCPFGALQELTNQIGRRFGIPQWRLPWGLHERLWPVKYIIMLVLLGVSIVSMQLAEQYAEVEPFKTAIILKFARAWPYVLFVVVLLGIGLFIERFYCRYLCPLGGALAVPGRMRMFDWLKRYKECGNPCQTCANECFVQSIHPTGEINPNECLQCLHCQVLYQDHEKCPVVIKRDRRRRKTAESNAISGARLEALINHPNHPNQPDHGKPKAEKEKSDV